MCFLSREKNKANFIRKTYKFAWVSIKLKKKFIWSKFFLSKIVYKRKLKVEKYYIHIKILLDNKKLNKKLYNLRSMLKTD